MYMLDGLECLLYWMPKTRGGFRSSGAVAAAPACAVGLCLIAVLVELLRATVARLMLFSLVSPPPGCSLSPASSCGLHFRRNLHGKRDSHDLMPRRYMPQNGFTQRPRGPSRGRGAGVSLAFFHNFSLRRAQAVGTLRVTACLGWVGDVLNITGETQHELSEICSRSHPYAIFFGCGCVEQQCKYRRVHALMLLTFSNGGARALFRCMVRTPPLPLPLDDCWYLVSEEMGLDSECQRTPSSSILADETLPTSSDVACCSGSVWLCPKTFFLFQDGRVAARLRLRLLQLDVVAEHNPVCRSRVGLQLFYISGQKIRAVESQSAGRQTGRRVPMPNSAELEQYRELSENVLFGGGTLFVEE